MVFSAMFIASCAASGPPRVASSERSKGEAGASGGGGERRADRDHDGVPDEDDRCPDTPEDCDGFQDLDGCPDDDNDGDGIPDRCDRCPDLRAQRRNGCPLVRLMSQEIVVPFVATFERNQTKPTFSPDLAEAFPALKDARVRRIGIVGHALASEKNAPRLAARRAEAARDALVAGGVPVEKLELRAAPPGNLDGCPSGPGYPPSQVPCVSFAAADLGGVKMTWNGERYLAPPTPPPPDEPAECAPPQTEGRDCSKGE